MLWKRPDLKADPHEKLLPALLKRQPDLPMEVLQPVIESHPFLLGTLLEGKSMTAAAHVKRWDVVDAMIAQMPRLLAAQSSTSVSTHLGSTVPGRQAIEAEQWGSLERLWPLYSAANQEQLVHHMLLTGHDAQHEAYAQRLAPEPSREGDTETFSKRQQKWLYVAMTLGNVAYLEKHQSWLTADQMVELFKGLPSNFFKMTFKDVAPEIENAEPAVRHLLAHMPTEVWLEVSRHYRRKEGRTIVITEALETLARYAPSDKREALIREYGEAKLPNLTPWHRAQERATQLENAPAPARPARRIRS